MTTKLLLSDIKVLANNNQILILKTLGFEINNSDHIQQTCPIHKGDNPTAFNYDLNKKIWSCFTHKCEKQFGNDIIGLIRAITNTDYKHAMSFLSTLLVEKGVNFKLPQLIEDNDIFFNSYPPFFENNVFLSESVLNNIESNHSFLQERGLSKKVSKTFQIGIHKSDNEIHNRYIFPIRDINHKLVGLTGRSIYAQCNKCKVYHDSNNYCPIRYRNLYSKWRHYPQKLFKRSLNLYNINKAKETISKTNKVYLVEGPIDVISLWDKANISNVVASFGTSLSREQANLLLQCGCIQMCILFDFDENLAGQKGIEDIYSKYKKIFNITSGILPKGQDPGSLSKNDLLKIL